MLAEQTRVLGALRSLEASPAPSSTLGVVQYVDSGGGRILPVVARKRPSTARAALQTVTSPTPALQSSGQRNA